MAKHYRTLQAWYNKKKNPDYVSVSQLLDLEYAARRAFIDSDATQVQVLFFNSLLLSDSFNLCFGLLDIS